MCPFVRGTIEASFVDGDTTAEIDLHFRDFWQRGGDSLTGEWKVALTSAGDLSYANPPPWREVPDPPRRRVALTSTSKHSGCGGMGRAAKIPASSGRSSRRAR